MKTNKSAARGVHVMVENVAAALGDTAKMFKIKAVR